MLSEKPWRGGAVLRYLLSIIIFVTLGSLLIAVIGYLGHVPHRRPVIFGALTLGSIVGLIASLKLLHRGWREDSLTLDLGIFLFALYVGLVLGLFAMRYAPTAIDDLATWRVTIGALSLQGSAILLSVTFAHENELKWPEAYGFNNNRPRAVFWGIVTVMVCLPVGLILQGLSLEVMERFAREVKPQTAVQALYGAEGWPSRIALGIVTILLAPVAEEIIFRGILYPAVKRLGYPRLALWGTALLFAAIHNNLPIFLPLLVLALALTFLYEQTDNLLAPIVAHGLFNAYNFAIFFLQDRLNH